MGSFRHGFAAGCFLSGILGIAGCGGPAASLAVPSLYDADQPGLAFVRVPGDAVLNGTFELRLRLNDEKGHQRTADDQTLVSVTVAGNGVLAGTTTQKAEAGFVRFDDLHYDTWETISLLVSAPGYAPVSTRLFVVRPYLRFVEVPPARAAVDSAVGPFSVELVDARGVRVPSQQVVTLQSTQSFAVIEGGGERNLTDGEARFAAVTFLEAGPQSVSLSADGLSPLVQGLVAYGGTKTESLWLPSARVGAPYHAALPAGEVGYVASAGQVPTGLVIDDKGNVSGQPTEAGQYNFSLQSQDKSGAQTTWLAFLSVFPLEERATLGVDALDRPGPFAVGQLDTTILVKARGEMAPLRIFYPSDGGKPASGPFPLIAFHHGSGRFNPAHPLYYDQYDQLLRRWASHGFVVTTIDGSSLVYQAGGYSTLTIMNLNLMAEDLRASIAYLRAMAQEDDHPLNGKIDLDRIVVAGHSRGGGAALIALQTNPAIMGAILIKPVDPLIATGGDAMWNRKLPAKPILTLLGGNDADVFYPLAELIFERRSAAMSVVDIVGSIHAFSCDACDPERGAMPEISREQDRSITNAYSLAFLKYLAGGDLGYAPLLFGPEGQSSALSPKGVLRESDRHAALLLVDDFQQASETTNSLGLPVHATGFEESHRVASTAKAAQETDAQLGTYIRGVFHRQQTLDDARVQQLRWRGGGASYSSSLGVLDLHEAASFILRARSDEAPLTAAQIKIRFVDTEGDAQEVTGEEVLGPQGIGNRFTDLIVPLAGPRRAGLDLSRLAVVELILGGEGTLLIDDLRFE